MESELGKQKTVLTDRKHLHMNGILYIRSSDEQQILLAGTDFQSEIEGNSLQIISLQKETGDIEITGEIRSFYFEEKNLTTKTGHGKKK